MRVIWTILFAAFLVACGEPTEPLDVKPAANPDDGLVETRADRVSNNYTSIVGTAAIGERIEGRIGYPDWFHGYLVELEAGDEVRFDLTSGERSLVRFYGPAKYRAWNGRPLFARHEVSEVMEPSAGSWATSFVYEPLETGLYLIVTGPLDVWDAKYDIELTCVGGGCVAQPGACDSNADCAAGEVCADNGVRCVTEPCDANYDVCQPAPTSECQTERDCDSGFCRFANPERTHMECVPYAEEGDSCGGFVPADMIEICEPSLACVTRPFVADAPGICRVRATVDALVSDPRAFLGQRVVIDGEIGTDLAYCTRMACSSDNPCCNRCGAAQVLRDAADGAPLQLRADGSTFGCQGDECNVTETCDLVLGAARVLGVLTEDGYGGHFIEVETVTEL